MKILVIAEHDNQKLAPATAHALGAAKALGAAADVLVAGHGCRAVAEQAAKLGKPQAVRAVANANGANRVSIIIPCHRVIGKDGSLTGYAGGLARKQWLLEHEHRYVGNARS